MLHKELILFLLVFIIFSCEKDPLSVKKEKPKIVQGAFIVNEGNFSLSNASLSYYDFSTRTISNNLFKSVNGRRLGDVAQSMTIIDTLGFIVVNNSNKIEVIGIHSIKSLATISMPDSSSPRNLADGDNGKLYVTNMNTNSVSVIDKKTFKVENNIAVGPKPEEILTINGKAYVANGGFGYNNTVSVIDLKKNRVVKTISVGDYPAYLQKINNGDISILCQGRWPSWSDTTDKGTQGGIYNINTQTDEVVDSLKVSGNVFEFTYDGNATGYFIKGIMVGNIVSYSTVTMKIQSDTLFKGVYYAVETDPTSGNIFALDAKDFSQNGELKIFGSRGDLLETHTVGIGPGAVCFVTNGEGE